jgi:hypothetical protein
LPYNIMLWLLWCEKSNSSAFNSKLCGTSLSINYKKWLSDAKIVSPLDGYFLRTFTNVVKNSRTERKLSIDIFNCDPDNESQT